MIEKNSTMIIHHFDDMFSSGLESFNTDLDELSEKMIDFIIKNSEKIDRVILTTFEENELTHHKQRLIKEVVENLDIEFDHIIYGYGWYRDSEIDEDLCESFPLDDFGKTWIHATRDSSDSEKDVLMVEDWHYELKNKNVVLTGAFHGECLDDLNTVLEHCDSIVNYYKPLCVGTMEKYEFQMGGFDIQSDIENIANIFENYRIDYMSDIKDLYNDDADEYFCLIDDVFEAIDNMVLKEEKISNIIDYDNLCYDIISDLSIVNIGGFRGEFENELKELKLPLVKIPEIMKNIKSIISSKEDDYETKSKPENSISKLSSKM